MNSKKTNTNKCFVVNIPQIVTTRKYKVDIDSLKILLRNSKKASKLSCKQISEILNKPVTLVEHWFRTDSCFAIPDDDIWMDLKKILNININTFDKSIMTFEHKYGSYEKSEWCYLSHGISPTLTCDGNIKIIM